MAANPKFTNTVRTGGYAIAAGDTTGIIDVLAISANESRLESVTIKANAATTVINQVYLYLHDGSTSFMIKSVLVAAVTAAADAQAPETTVPLGVDVPAGWKVQASVFTTLSGGSQIECIAFAADYD